MNTRISINPEIRFGKPCVKGTRIAVSDILSLLAAGYAIEQIPEQYPTVSKKDVVAAIEFASHSIERPLEIIGSS